MQYSVVVQCGGCKRSLDVFRADTARVPSWLLDKMESLVLDHRPACPFYGPRPTSAVYSGSSVPVEMEFDRGEVRLPGL